MKPINFIYFSLNEPVADDSDEYDLSVMLG